MRKLASRSWNWFASQIKTVSFKNGRQGRIRRNGVFSSIAAEIERLESRALMTVTYHGGALLTAVEAQAVYLGGDWNSTSALQTQTGQLDQFLSTLVNSPYMDMLTNAGYNVGRGTTTAGAIDNVTLSKVASVGVTDAQIQGFLQSMITAKQVQAPDANRLYVVYVEPGVVVHDGSDASNTTFLGYHGAFGGTNSNGQAADIRYDVLPYPGAPNFSSQSQGFASDFDELTAVTSHELAEAATDPDVDYKTLGWYDDNLNGEIGDIVTTSTVMSGYVVQELVDQNDNAISPGSSPTPAPPPPVRVGPPSVSDFTNQRNGLTAHVVQNGSTTVVFINEFGNVVLGTMTDSTHATVAAWGHDVATFGAGKITWSDGSVWNATAAGNQVSVFNYTDQANGMTAHVVQDGSNSTLVFINEYGNVVLGKVADSRHATVADWGNDLATFRRARITWSDGSVWNNA